MKKNNKNIIYLYLFSIFIIIIFLIGVTYAYFTTNVNGNTTIKSTSMKAADLKLVYGDGNGYIEARGIKPGTTLTTKTFTVKNEGSVKVEDYTVYLNEVYNELKNDEDLVYTLDCKNIDPYGNEEGTCNKVYETKYPSTNGIVVKNDIEENYTQLYTFTLFFKETGKNQSVDMKKTINGKLDIRDYQELLSETNQLLFSKLKIYGNTIQNGTPTPTLPVKVASLGENSKNIYNFSYHNLKTFVTNSQTFKSGYDFGVLPEGDYTLSFELESTTIPTYLYFYKKDTEGAITFLSYLTTTEIKNNPYTFNADGTSSYIMLNASSTYPFIYTFEKLDLSKNWQLEKGNSKTTYEIPKYIKINNTSPSNPESITINLIQNLLNKYEYDFGHVYDEFGEYLNDDNTVLTNMVPTSNMEYIYEEIRADGLITAETRVNYFDSAKKWISQEKYTGSWNTNNGYSKRIVIPDNAKYINISLNKKFIDSYKLYKEIEPLRKINNIADEMDFKDNTIKRYIGKYEFTGNETFTMTTLSNGDKMFMTYDLHGKYIFDITTANMLCTHFKNVIQRNRINGTVSQANNKRIDFIDNSIESKEEFKNYLKNEYDKGTPVTIYYLLKEPTIEVFNTNDIIFTKDHNLIVKDYVISASKIEY